MADPSLLKEDETADPRPEGHPQSVYGGLEKEKAEQEEIPVLDQLAEHVTKQWYTNRDDRTKVEHEMLRMQEAVNGQYDPDTLNAIRSQGGSQIFIPLTSMQTNAGASWLLAVLNPPGDKAFSFKSTPIPTLPQSLKDRILQDVKNKIKDNAPKVAPPGGPEAPPPPGGLPSAGGPPPMPGVPPGMGEAPPTGVPAGPDGEALQPRDVMKIAEREQAVLFKELKKESVKRAERMEGLVHDQLLDSDWYSVLEDFVTDLVSYPSAFIKTTYEYKKKMRTVVKDGSFTMESEESLVAKDHRVSAFDIYPSPDQTTIHDGSLIERLKLSRKSIYDCLDKPGYSNEMLTKVLMDFDQQSTSFIAWQSAVDSTRRYAENHSTDFSGQDGSIYGLRFLGPVAIGKLLDWGYNKKDLIKQGFLTKEESKDKDRCNIKEIDIDAILIGNYIIKVTPNIDPEGKRPFYMASYRKVPGSFWGKSVAMLAQPHQRMVNAATRALSNNMGIASGPQIVVYTDRLPNGESIQEIRPLKIWQMTSDPAGSNAVPMQFFQPQSNAQELMSVYQYYADSVGDVTGIPKMSYSSSPSAQQQGAQTASGMAMMLETASKQIKQAVRNIDTGVIEPRLRYQYRTNMMDTSVSNAFKGDMSIEAIGAKSIVAKAVDNQRSMELLQATSNPLDMEVLGKEGRAALLRNVIRGYDMTGVVPTEEDIEEQEKAKAQQPPPPTPEETKLEIEKMRSETRLKDQELEGELSRQQQETDLAIANIELEKKNIDAQIAITNNQANNSTKMKETALKEKNMNARHSSEMVAKAKFGTGI